MRAGSRIGHVLVVDDNPTNLRMLSRWLTRQGYRVTGCTDGESALEAAFAGAPDIVLMDLRMPGMGGAEAAAALKADPRTVAVPVIIVSASVLPDERERVRRSGVAGFVGKPIDFAELAVVLDRYLGRGGQSAA